MKRLLKDVHGFNRAVIGTSFGATILQRVGGSVANSGLQGLQQASSFFPVMGGLLGAKQSLKLLKRLK